MSLDPTMRQAVSYAAWYMARGASDGEIDGRLAQSRDHKWMSAADRANSIDAARQNVRLLQALWARLPHLKVEMTPASRIRRHRRTRPLERGEG